jgi:hypothetical protein
MWSCLTERRFEELSTFDNIEGERSVNNEEMARKSLLTSELENSILQEEISWKQKSRVLWLKEGDKCTKFFHRVFNSNRRFNSIESLLVNGSISGIMLSSSMRLCFQNTIVGGAGWMALLSICWTQRRPLVLSFLLRNGRY